MDQKKLDSGGDQEKLERKICDTKRRDADLHVVWNLDLYMLAQSV